MAPSSSLLYQNGHSLSPYSFASSSSLLFSSSTSTSTSTLFFFPIPISISVSTTKPHCHFLSPKAPLPKRSLSVVSSALAESDSPNNFLEDSTPQPQFLLQQLADSFDLPPDYFAQLPRDLRLDLNDAAFDIGNGPVIDQCGKDLGETLLDLSRAWELADTSSSSTLAKKLPLLQNSLTDNQRLSLGKRLISAGRRFRSMGQYGQGEFQKIAKLMISAGERLSATSVTPASTEVRPENEARTLKFGELQVEVTPQKAYIGAAIGLVFGVLSWEVSQGIQSIPDSSMEYANENALLLAKSLRGALLAMFYSSTVLSALASLGLLSFARQLSSKDK